MTRLFKVAQGHPLLCQSTRHIRLHKFLLAFNGNLTSIFNRSWDITFI